jgi:predicted nucleic acid-binding protein
VRIILYAVSSRLAASRASHRRGYGRRVRRERFEAAPDVGLQVTHTAQLDERRAQLALLDLLDLPIRRAPHAPLLLRCWELRDNLTIYDAAYIALAEALGTVLLTADTRLANAPGLICPVEVLSPRAAGA